MVRAYSSIGVQLGAETTPGTAVAASKKLLGLKVDHQLETETAQHKPSGFLVPVQSSTNVQKTTGSYEGAIDFNSIIYPLASLFGAPVTVAKTPPASTAYEHTFTFSGRGGINPKTFTFEIGDSGRANKFSYGVFSSLNMSIDRDAEGRMSGDILGRTFLPNQTLTASPTDINLRPVDGVMWDVFADPTSAALGGTKMNGFYEGDVNFSGLIAEEYPINSTMPSFTSLFTGESPTFDFSMQLSADATAEAYFDRLKNGLKTFIRLEAKGQNIGASSFPYSITIDACVSVTGFDSYASANEGLYVLPVNFTLSYDSTWNKSMVIKVVNDVATL